MTASRLALWTAGLLALLFLLAPVLVVLPLLLDPDLAPDALLPVLLLELPPVDFAFAPVFFLSSSLDAPKAAPAMAAAAPATIAAVVPGLFLTAAVVLLAAPLIASLLRPAASARASLPLSSCTCALSAKLVFSASVVPFVSLDVVAFIGCLPSVWSRNEKPTRGPLRRFRWACTGTAAPPFPCNTSA